MIIDFEWDERKRVANLDRHGIDFLRAVELFDGRPVMTIASPYPDEERFLTTGVLEDCFITAVWTFRGESLRLISVRRARDDERNAHHSRHG